MHTYVFKDIAVGGHLNSLEKYTVSLTIRIKLRISIYIQEYCNRWQSSFSSLLYCACVISICHMIPAKMTCPAAWSKSDSNKTNDRVLCKNIKNLCVEENSEYLWKVSWKQNLYRIVFYLVQAACCSLSCPPYESSQTISCVVCSK